SPISCSASFGKIQCQDILKTRRPQPYGSAQDQQYHRTDLTSRKTRQETHHCRNWRRAAWRGYWYGLCIKGIRMCGLYGRDRYPKASSKCCPYENDGRQGRSCDFGEQNLERCNQRSVKRLDKQSCRYTLYHRLRCWATSISGYGG